MNLTPEQTKIGKENFADAVGLTRRDLLKGVAAGATGLGAMYFGYSELKGAPVKTGFVGTGDEGNILLTQHPPAYMDVVAVADLRPSNRERAFQGDPNDDRIGLVRKLGAAAAGKVKVYESHKALLAAKDELGLEAVVIAVPLSEHYSVAKACLEAGLHVLCEKLMCRTITQCKELIRLAESKNLLLTVGHQRHYSVLYDNAANLVQTGLLGEIKHIRAQWHRNNSFPNSDQWRKTDLKESKEDIAAMANVDLKEFGYTSIQQLINWRLYNTTGGGLMAELGSHQMDAASIFLGKVHPLAVQGFGGRNFYGVPGVGSPDKQKDDREIDDHVYVTYEFPGRNYAQAPEDLAVVTYSSINTNKFEPYGETVFGSRGTMIVKTEKEAMLYKEEGKGSTGGGPDQRLWVVSNAVSGGPVLNAYETSAGPKVAAGGADWSANISRGYTEEMEHFCYAIRSHGPQYYRDGKLLPVSEGGLRCPGPVAMADAIMALTANLAMEKKKRIEFRDEWFDPKSDAVPETDPQVVG
ncbi:MAG: gfo/Idh/MocA family oxidoreductase [Planctomycetota bacterium]|nr:MAG: gfo/Idh/MocA family oxidoreductase [Planctomycetota bacterium]